MTVQAAQRTIIAVPVTDGKLCSHFGHCRQFAFFQVDLENRRIYGARYLKPPPHEPGVLPRWLHENDAHIVIAGGMGGRAQNLFREQGMEVVVGAEEDEARNVVQAYLDGKLSVAPNPCDH